MWVVKCGGCGCSEYCGTLIGGEGRGWGGGGRGDEISGRSPWTGLLGCGAEKAMKRMQIGSMLRRGLVISTRLHRSMMLMLMLILLAILFYYLHG